MAGMNITRDRYDATLAGESRRFRAAVAGADPADPVPTCTPWTLSDLLWHLTEVQGFWAAVVERRPQGPEEIADPTRPAAFPDLLERFDLASAALNGALAAASDDAPAWTWSEDHTVGFIRRRQAHEALIHRVDAEVAAGMAVAPVAAEVAADGVDEVLGVMVDGIPEWGSFHPDAGLIRVETTDTGHAWHLRPGRFRGTSPDSGNTYDLDTAMLETGSEPVACVVRAPAWELDRWLWGRAGPSVIDHEGDESLVVRLRAIVSESTQ